jgi:hypothetical protein
MAGARRCQPDARAGASVLQAVPSIGQVRSQPVLAAVVVEHRRDGRMVDRLVAVVGNEVLLADVGDVAALRILGEEVVEGLVLGRPESLGDGLIPFLAIGEERVDVEDHSTEIEQTVAHDLAEGETGAGHLDLRGHGQRTLGG